MTRSSEKTVSPRLATAMAFALIVVALSGSSHAAALSTCADAELRHIDRSDRARMLAAAALAATRDLLGVNFAHAALELGETFTPVAAGVRSRIPMVSDVTIRTKRLSPRLTNLPPPSIA